MCSQWFHSISAMWFFTYACSWWLSFGFRRGSVSLRYITLLLIDWCLLIFDLSSIWVYYTVWQWCTTMYVYWLLDFIEFWFSFQDKSNLWNLSKSKDRYIDPRYHIHCYHVSRAIFEHWLLLCTHDLVLSYKVSLCPLIALLPTVFYGFDQCIWAGYVWNFLYAWVNNFFFSTNLS